MKVCALVAHPDDELMCAGTLARLSASGHGVALVVGLFSDFGPEGEKQGLREERLNELERSAEAINCDLVGRPVPDEADFAFTQRWVQHFDRLVDADLLISHRVNDANSSHHHLGMIARTLARKNRTQLWEMDKALPGGTTGQAPTFFVNIDSAAARKAAAVDAYRSQEKRYPGLSDAIELRDRLYGWEIGCRYAEGFTVVKGVW